MSVISLNQSRNFLADIDMLDSWGMRLDILFCFYFSIKKDRQKQIVIYYTGKCLSVFHKNCKEKVIENQLFFSNNRRTKSK